MRLGGTDSDRRYQRDSGDNDQGGGFERLHGTLRRLSIRQFVQGLRVSLADGPTMAHGSCGRSEEFRTTTTIPAMPMPRCSRQETALDRE
jgi:hypothetical protein